MSIEAAVILTDRLTLSYLWVLGAYEVVRTIDQWAKRHDSVWESELRARITDTKQEIARIRVPLAKLEPSGRYRHSDSPVAYPTIDSKSGIAWHIAPDVVVSRRELADHILQLLSSLAAVTGDPNGSVKE
jgi:hypothetical protein